MSGFIKLLVYSVLYAAVVRADTFTSPPVLRPQFVQTNTVTISTTGAQTLMGTGVGSLTLPANFFTVGSVLRYEIAGSYGTTGTPGTDTFTVILGGTNIETSVATTLPASSSSQTFVARGTITCITTGVSGSVSITGTMLMSTQTPAAPWVVTMTAGATTVNTTTSLLFDFQNNFGSAGQVIITTSVVLASY